MKHSLNIALALIASVALSLFVATQVYAAEKQGRVDGTIGVISKDTSTITVRLRSSGQQRQVVWTNDTKFTKAKGRKSEPSTMDEVVKEGQRVIAVGKFNDKTQLVATQISLREHP